MALLACAQEVKFFNMLLEEIAEVQKTVVVYENNQGDIFLANNRQVDMHTNHIYIRRHFMRNMVEEKDMDVKYIRSQKQLTDIMTKRYSKYDYVKHTMRIKEG